METSDDRWLNPEGKVVACKEKIKVLSENFEEIRSMLQDAIDDAVLMGCSEKVVRDLYVQMVSQIHSAYPEKTAADQKGPQK